MRRQIAETLVPPVMSPPLPAQEGRGMFPFKPFRRALVGGLEHGDAPHPLHVGHCSSGRVTNFTLGV